MAVQIFPNLLHGKTDRAEVSNDIEPPDIVDAIVAVSGRRTFRVNDSNFFIIAYRIDADVI